MLTLQPRLKHSKILIYKRLHSVVNGTLPIITFNTS